MRAALACMTAATGGETISSVVSVQIASQRRTSRTECGRRAEVSLHRIALVAAAGQHHRRPEVGQGRQVMVPVLDRVVEHRPQLGVGADAGVEAPSKAGRAASISAAWLGSMAEA
jgi:hypothetical protein